jgi:hypothetical protein
MATDTDIIVVRHLAPGMAGSQSPRVISRHASGPRGWSNAVKSYREDCRTACFAYGNLGLGSGWIEVVAKGNGPNTGIIVSDLHPQFTYGEISPPVGADFEWWQTLAGYGIATGCLPSLDRETKALRPWNGPTWRSRGKTYGARKGTYCEGSGHTFMAGVCASCGLEA